MLGTRSRDRVQARSSAAHSLILHNCWTVLCWCFRAYALTHVRPVCGVFAIPPCVCTHPYRGAVRAGVARELSVSLSSRPGRWLGSWEAEDQLHRDCDVLDLVIGLVCFLGSI